MGLIPSQETEITRATEHGQKQQQKAKFLLKRRGGRNSFHGLDILSLK